MEPDTLCDKIIEYFHNAPEKRKGAFGHSNVVDTEIKDSTDTRLLPSPEYDLYTIHLRKCMQQYIDKFKFASENMPEWGLRQYIQIQHYEPSQGYFQWHCERIGSQPPTSYRHLVFMTYLNTVTDGGETEFYYQNVKIKPEKGLTLIWPVDWTHTHRGITSHTENKYITTGWMSFY